MIDNSGLLKSLMTRGRIRLQDGDTLREIPPPLPESIGFQKVEGMLLGLAIGDSLGAASEGMLPSERLRRHGEVRGYLASRISDWRPVGVPTGDTQLSFWTLEQLIIDVPEEYQGAIIQELSLRKGELVAVESTGTTRSSPLRAAAAITSGRQASAGNEEFSRRPSTGSASAGPATSLP